jgi:hypothetical protein
MCYEECLQTCDGVLWVYGQMDACWVVAQLARSQRILGRREKPAAVGIVLGPPPENKGDVPAGMRRLRIVNCREGIQPDELLQFVAQVKSSQASV